MYESFYGLKDRPFSMLPDPGFLYLSKKHQTALTMLEYALYNNAGLCVISGDIGAGKTTLLRKLLESMEDNVTVGMITNTHQSFGELLDWVLSAYGIHQPGLNKVEAHQAFLDFLLAEYAKQKTVLLIVDEAQNMSAETLEELRMLSNINTGKDQLLQIILAGQPELKDTLRRPELKQFIQRIAVDYHLGALTRDETFGYIRHRLVTAGAKRDIFTPLACERIHEYSGGVPRLINLLCDTVMVYGFADQAKLIGENLVDEMVRERMADSLVPIQRPERTHGNEPTPPEPAPSTHLSGVGSESKKTAARSTAEKKTVKKSRPEQAPRPTTNVVQHTSSRSPRATLKAVSLLPQVDDEALPELLPDSVDTEPATAIAAEADDLLRDQPDSPMRAEAGNEREGSVSTDPPPPPQPVLSAALSHSGPGMDRWLAAGLVALVIVALLIYFVATSRARVPVALPEPSSTTPEQTPPAETEQEKSTRLERELEQAQRQERELREQYESRARLLQEQRDAAEAKAEAQARKAEDRVQAAEAARLKAQREIEVQVKQAAQKREAAAEMARQLTIEKELQTAIAEEEERRVQELERHLQQLQIPVAAPQAVVPSIEAPQALPKNEPATSNAVSSDPELEFATDPCQGPSARFLSTCRK